MLKMTGVPYICCSQSCLLSKFLVLPPHNAYMRQHMYLSFHNHAFFCTLLPYLTVYVTLSTSLIRYLSAYQETIFRPPSLLSFSEMCLWMAFFRSCTVAFWITTTAENKHTQCKAAFKIVNVTSLKSFMQKGYK